MELEEVEVGGVTFVRDSLGYWRSNSVSGVLLHPLGQEMLNMISELRNGVRTAH
jgi:hypothetical protein